MKRRHYSVEYAHIYTDEAFGDEQHQGTILARDVILTLQPHTVTKVILIDNYNPAMHTLQVSHYLNQLAQAGLAPDGYVFEADMVPHADTMLNHVVDRRLRRSYERYIELKNHFPCSLLAATWYFMRLGIIVADSRALGPQAIKLLRPADILINILPERFEALERTVDKLIAGSDRPETLKQIRRIFFPDVNVSTRVMS